VTAATLREVSLKDLGAGVLSSSPLEVPPWQGGRGRTVGDAVAASALDRRGEDSASKSRLMRGLG
ncbi:hypothetical protein N330_04803, partial [Leptosomus discolor]